MKINFTLTNNTPFEMYQADVSECITMPSKIDTNEVAKITVDFKNPHSNDEAEASYMLSPPSGVYLKFSVSPDFSNFQYGLNSLNVQYGLNVDSSISPSFTISCG